MIQNNEKHEKDLSSSTKMKIMMATNMSKTDVENSDKKVLLNFLQRYLAGRDYGTR